MGRLAVILPGAMVVGILVAIAGMRWDEALGKVDLGDLKKRFVTESKIETAHNEVYQKVGEETWEAHAKPWFLREVAARASDEVGHPFPSDEEIIDWAKRHPDEVKELLRQTGARFEKVER